PYILEMAGNIDNVGLKVFADGNTLYIRGTSVPKGDPSRAAQLSEAPADLAVIDEFDKVPPAAVPLVRDRISDSRIEWELDLSTPTYPGFGIDEEYQGSSQCEPRIKCAECGAWHWLTWSLVRGPVADDPHARVICPLCHAPIDRDGMWDKDQPGGARCRWEDKNPGAAVMGFWIPKLVSDRVDLDGMWKRSKSTSEIKLQAFWNGDLGLPHEPKGARLSKEIISACAAHQEVYPTFPDRARWCAMGVDVGIELHYWVKQRMNYGRERTVAIGSVLTWEELDPLMVRYDIQRCVVDDAPELREDVKFQRRFRGKVWLGQSVDSPAADIATWVKKRGVVKVERTKGLAEAGAKMELCIDELPADWETVPDLLDHLTVNIKAKKVRADGSTSYHFPKTGKPDHLHHAKMFCEVAMIILPPDPGGEAEGGGEESVPTVGKKGYYAPQSVRGTL
ncbi:unnamed protein product, partial [marine sediment metagenome]